MKACDFVASFLREKKVTHVYELIGGMITFLIDALHRQGAISIVSVHHEQAAAFAAEGYARAQGIPGVAFATSGPGATNLLTGIGSCYFDSVPTLFITGQVNRHEMKGDRPIRQLGFQETDIVSMARPITKAAWQVQNASELPALLERAFTLTMEGRPGPVLIDIPMDVQRSEIEGDFFPSTPVAPEGDSIPVDLLKSLDAATRPLILAGGGVRSGGAIEAYRAWIERAAVPAVHSLMGVDLLPFHHPLRVGMIGSYGNRHANHALSRSDFVLVLGSRLDVRQTGASAADFKGKRPFYHIDCDAGEMNNRVTGCIPVHATLKSFLANALRETSPRQPRDAWLREISHLRDQWPDSGEYVSSGINPNEFMQCLSRFSERAAGFVTDVGQHQMWAAQSLRLKEHQRFLTSGGMGAMGFGLPAAIGFCQGSGNRPAVLVAGDGGFQCNIQELQTVRRNNLPVKVALLNNRCHGMVRQFQQSYFAERYQSSQWGYDAPDFVRLAEAYGLPARRISRKEEQEDAVRWLWNDPSSPSVLEVMIEPHGNVYPKLAFGRPLHEMEPAVQPTAMEST